MIHIINALQLEKALDASHKRCVSSKPVDDGGNPQQALRTGYTAFTERQ
jgi:hypothetical protein